MTRGEYRVGTRCTATSDARAHEIKQAAANLIDLIGSIPDGEVRGHAAPEVGRCKALAMTAVEEAAMWAVKAATKPEPVG